MNTKIVLTGIISFIAGALLVAIVGSTMDKPEEDSKTPTHTMTEDLKDKVGSEFDKSFLSQMITHHESALDMARLAERQAAHAELKDLAKKMREIQENEINIMRQWQVDWGYGASMSDMHR
ncbi:MAG TPA: DUF305 domain-containing protein [Candidatus Saccharimonadales bacterium]|nr:DUF305 domain-containing protein [Candidatus Saccharimonadales bacterium]